ncbi:glutathione S-transferase [Atopomonas sediminilitoris]|uniref:glutathione S-transferase n=1 Tax=Atopomonas sediminilitoris TaxID=2919919 RepID=UPI001F4DADF6|nr:glutathione S-transferase [Atopomonas sediminilitoris]MCJ8170585.1 glutathione S-transferase [Atopomonas sediminilitoris]
MLTIHHLNNSRSQRVLWLLEELAVPYRIEHYQRDAKTNLAPESLKAVHPLGKSPVLTDDEVVVAESAVIIEHLIEHHGQGRFQPSAASEAARQARYWLHYAEGSLMPFLVMSLVFRKIKEAPMPFFIKPVAKGIANQVMQSFVEPNVSTHLRYIDTHLATHTWFAGDELSAADFQMIFPLEAAISRSTLAQQLPNIAAYVKRVHARPAYQQALSKGGPYDYA